MKATNQQIKPATLIDYIVTNREILGGEPVFRGTRVPVASLFEHLESDCLLDEFLENFPTVTRAVAVAVLTEAAWKIEVDRRVEEIQSGKVKGIPAEEISVRIQKILKR